MDALLLRHIASVATEMLSHFRAILIEGAPEVGKSTLTGEIADPDAVVTTMDRAQTRDAAIAEPAAFVAKAQDR